MIKKLSALILSAFLLFSLSTPVFADNHVDRIDIDAVINDDGSMDVTQLWSGDFNEGTENYIPMNAPDFLKIKNLKVSDQNGEYTFVEDWDVDAKFDEKANKCGVNYTNNGYEICFGITSYGKNSYKLSYTLENVVGRYDDADGVNFRFINDEMNTTPTDASVKIRLANGTAITDDNSDIWAFGYDGQVQFEGGAISSFTDSPLKYDHHLTVMFSLDKGMINPARVESGKFDTVKEEAFKGSDYDSDKKGMLILIIIGSLLLLLIIIAVTQAIIEHVKYKKFCKESGYFRDIPNNGQRNVTYSLSCMFKLCDESAIIGMGMLRLIQKGYLAPIEEETTGFLGRTKKKVELKIVNAPDPNSSDCDKMDDHLFNLLSMAAGEDQSLQERELEKYFRNNDKLLRGYIDQCYTRGVTILSRDGCFSKGKKASSLKHLTPTGKAQLSQVIGFKQYLEEFSLVGEREINEVPIWRELLSYAMLFGIADKLADQMKSLYPEVLDEITLYHNNMYMAYFYSSMLYRNMRHSEQAREQAQRSSGSGGSASFGGGGGSFGGGSGGGSR